MSWVTHDPNPFDCAEPDKELTVTLGEGESVTCGECGTDLAVTDTPPAEPRDGDDG